ncbi:DUF1990 domain-containing protein [Corynebacterium sp. H127]|uniref:DUF1990 family protein n=1 Tax=Corynebacterium sp. H127 TaxID=3133418 RepID=UPI00309EE092
MAPVTYPAEFLGWSLDLDPHQAELTRQGWHCFTIRRKIGHGQATFREARRRLLAWEMQRAVRLRPLIDGKIITLHLGCLRQRCWIIHTTQSDTHACVAYGTLPGHLETGEESFRVWLEDGTVWAECAAFSRPASWVTQLGGSLARLLQRLIARRYLAALVPAD